MILRDCAIMMMMMMMVKWQCELADCVLAYMLYLYSAL